MTCLMPGERPAGVRLTDRSVGDVHTSPPRRASPRDAECSISGSARASAIGRPQHTNALQGERGKRLRRASRRWPADRHPLAVDPPSQPDVPESGTPWGRYGTTQMSIVSTSGPVSKT